MNANLITFEDKVTMAQNPSIPDKNKITSDDINQIKDAINSGLLNLIYPVISMANTHIGLNTKVTNNILYLLIETTIDRSNFSGWAEISFVYN